MPGVNRRLSHLIFGGQHRCNIEHFAAYFFDDALTARDGGCRQGDAHFFRWPVSEHDLLG